MLTMIVKATEYCNANCAYCAVRDKENKRERMSIETLRVLLERVAEYLEADAARRVTVTWHGGEPALMGAEFYRAVDLLGRERLRGNTQRLVHIIQSNITALSDEIAESWRDLGVRSVGTSFEYAPHVRGFGPSVDSDSYAKHFFGGLQTLRRHGMEAGVIYVVTARTVEAPIETMILLGNLLGKACRGRYRINPLYEEGEASREVSKHLAVTPEQFGHFLGRAYQFWHPRRHILDGVAPFNGIYEALRGNHRRLGCEDAGICGETHLGIGVRGDIFQCGRALDNDVLRFGTIFERSLAEVILEHPVKQELVSRPSVLRDSECAGCAFWDYCHGGCPIDSFVYHGDWHHKTHFCRTKQIVIGEYALPIHQRERRPDAVST
jgi:uncharacterized protein